jgi:predicted PurR-regulated permease PerM
MYPMTGPSAEGDPGREAATGSEPSAGLRAGLRRLWRTGAVTSPAGNGGVGGQVAPGSLGATATTSAGAGPGAAAGAEGPAAPAAERARPSADAQVPRLLQVLAAWSWRLLLVGAVIYLGFRFTVELRLVVIPFIAALLLTALLQPEAHWLRQHGFSPMLATWCMILIALVVIAGAITLITNQIADQYQSLFTEVTRTATHLEHSLAGAPFHLNKVRLQTLTKDMLNYISQHKSVVAGTVLTGGKYVGEFLAGAILTLFITFFLLKDGARIWAWLIKGMRPVARSRTDRAGNQAWRALVYYMRGATAVAAIHAVLLGVALWLLGVPLLVPLVVLIFLAAYVPLVGILVAGALAVLVALATKGWVAAVILLGVLIVENQIEDHLLQPLVVGRIIRLHPLAIILALAVGGIIAGVPGAIIAVPFAAVITYAWPELRGDPPGG